MPGLDRSFDLIVSTGVLHHLAEPRIGMKALGDVLRPDGVAAIMLYARYGRAGVELMQAIFRELGLQQDEDSLRLVKQAIGALPQTHPLRRYLAIAPDLEFDAGLVDTFLHGRDPLHRRRLPGPGRIGRPGLSGLAAQNVVLPADPHPARQRFFAAVNQLPPEKIWSVMERINTQNGCHFFTACRPEREPSSYRIDFSAADALDYVPLLRLRCGVSGNEIYRPGWRIRLDPTHLAFAQQVDGDRSIREIAARVAQSGCCRPTSRSWNTSAWNCSKDCGGPTSSRSMSAAPAGLSHRAAVCCNTGVGRFAGEYRAPHRRYRGPNSDNSQVCYGYSLQIHTSRAAEGCRCQW